LNEFHDISIPLRFNGPQPNAYGVERAVARACEAGGIVGDTRRGGSVNFEQYTFIPHCNGTHTECVGHITHERFSVRDCLQDVLVPAMLVSVEPILIDGDLVIARSSFDQLEASGTLAIRPGAALVVRTLPNDDSKLERQYGDPIPPYFSSEAMAWIVNKGFAHLVVDIPSIDRIFDGGKLLNHRKFWNVEPESFERDANTRINSTITELTYIPNSVADGPYTLNLQIAPFDSDCAPSRPILLPYSGSSAIITA
jgi:arylformamidase